MTDEELLSLYQDGARRRAGGNIKEGLRAVWDKAGEDAAASLEVAAAEFARLSAGGFAWQAGRYLSGARPALRAHIVRLAEQIRGLELLRREIESARMAARHAGALVERLTRERDEARDDAARFRHELKLAEGLLSKPGVDVGGVIAGLRLAQKRETGTWAIPAEKMRGEP